MLNKCESARERWGGVSEVIDRWLKERQELLILFCNLSKDEQIITEEDQEEKEAQLRRFCQILVDYVSAGHFEIYSQLAKEGREFGDEDGLTRAKKHYEVVDATTEHTLDFNDKYQETDDMSSLTQDLSSLGETLAVRFEAEDCMIEILHMAHKDQVT